jgi:hypothetical protein
MACEHDARRPIMGYSCQPALGHNAAIADLGDRVMGSRTVIRRMYLLAVVGGCASASCRCAGGLAVPGEGIWLAG